MDEKRRVLYASNLTIPVQQGNAPYLSITMRMFSTRPNRNADGVTERFIDAIIANQPEHVGLPLYADTKRLRNGDYSNLDHQFDPMSGEFLTEEIGSFCGFDKIEDEFGVSQFGEARVYKRSQAICAALQDLYNRQLLRVSFEIAYDTLLVVDGVEYIDASPHNVITGMAIVSRPAYPEAVATRLVAEEKGADTPPGLPVEQVVTPEDTSLQDLSQQDASPQDVPPQNTPPQDEPVQDDEQERVNDMTMEEAKARIAELETQVQDLGKQQEDKVAAPDDPDAAKEAPPTVPLADHEAEVSEKETEIATLKAQVAELTQAKQELDTLKQAQADAELAARQATLRTFAENYGLDVEKGPIADAVTALDYGTVIAAAAEKPDPQPKTAAVRPMADIAMDEPYGGILEKTQ